MNKTWYIVPLIALLAAGCTPKAIPLTSANNPAGMIATLSSAIQTGTASAPVEVSTATPEPQPAIETPAAPQATATQPAPAFAANASVAEDGLNLRIGPGESYRSTGLLDQGQALHMVGRSVTGLWIMVDLPDGRSGWVHAAYILPKTEIAGLPVSEAYGGPLGEQPDKKTVYNILVGIADRTATVALEGYPADVAVEARLGRLGESATLRVAKGRTGNDGKARLSFEMPDTWPDGSSVTENRFSLVVAAKDGSFSRTAELVYYHN